MPSRGCDSLAGASSPLFRVDTVNALPALAAVVPGVLAGDDGSAHSVGAPTVDLDSDGSPDTAVIHNSDGSTTAYTDRDGDGSADQITQIDAERDSRL